MLKRVLALTLALVLCLGILAGCQETPAGTTAPAAGTTAPTGTTAPAETTAPTEPEPTSLFNAEDNVVIDIWMPNNTSLDPEGCWANVAIENTINAKVEIFEYEGEAYSTAMAEQKVPQLTYSNSLSEGKTYGPDGAYINWYDYLDQMPNVKAVIEDERWAAEVEKYTYEEGVMYQLPIPQTGQAGVYGYIYRQDIFEKHNLAYPTTQEEFYNTLVKLKELYPDSYPFVMRQMTGNMQGFENWCCTWGTHHLLYGYSNTIMKLDRDTNTYFLAQVSEPMREAVAFMNKLLDEGLMHPSSLTMDNAGWTEAFASEKSFITYSRVDGMVNMLISGVDKDAIPGYTVTAGAPIAMGSQGVAASKAVGGTAYSWLVSNLLEEEDLNNVLKYVDWLYSEEGILVSNWGIEGESYEVDANGKKTLIDGFEFVGSGLCVAGVCGYKDFSAYIAAQPENVQNALNICLEHATLPGDPVLSYTEEEQDYMDTYYKALYDASLAELQKFILGQRDTETDWEAFTNEMKALKMDEIIKIHQDAYNRIYG